MSSNIRNYSLQLQKIKGSQKMAKDQNTLLITILFCILVQGINSSSYTMTVSCSKCNMLAPICQLTKYNQCIYYDGGPFSNQQMQCALTSLVCAVLPIQLNTYECSACSNTCCQSVNNDPSTETCVSTQDAAEVCRFSIIDNLSIGAIIGIVIGCIVFIIIVGTVITCIRRRRNKNGKQLYTKMTA